MKIGMRVNCVSCCRETTTTTTLAFVSARLSHLFPPTYPLLLLLLLSERFEMDKSKLFTGTCAVVIFAMATLLVVRGGDHSAAASTSEPTTTTSSSSSGIDIKGLDKTVLLRALWEQAFIASYFDGHQAPAWEDCPLTDPHLRWSFDYHCGRAIKMDISQDTVNPAGYDRSGPLMSVRSIVRSLRNGANPGKVVRSRKCAVCQALETTETWEGVPVCTDCQQILRDDPSLAEFIRRRRSRV
jgi:hypothetical protein